MWSGNKGVCQCVCWGGGLACPLRKQRAKEDGGNGTLQLCVFVSMCMWVIGVLVEVHSSKVLEQKISPLSSAVLSFPPSFAGPDVKQ